MPKLPLSESGLKLKKLLEERAVFLDGAMGTLIQREKLAEPEFRRGVPELESNALPQLGNNDILNLTRPDVIAKINRAYYEAGSDIVTTGTFGANLLVQSEYGNGEGLVRRMNARAVEIAREEAGRASAKFGGKQLFVAGSVGPMNKSASISSDVDDPGRARRGFRRACGGLHPADGGFVRRGRRPLPDRDLFRHAQCQGRNIRVSDALRKVGRAPRPSESA